MEGRVEALSKRRETLSVSGPSSCRPQASNTKRKADQYTQKDDPEEKKAELHTLDLCGIDLSTIDLARVVVRCDCFYRENLYVVNQFNI